MRSGKTRLHYLKQKNQSHTYFRVHSGDLQRIATAQYTIFDFIANAFSFSTTKKELAITVLMELKQGPKSFIQLQKSLNLKKSSLYLVVLSLERAGLLQSNGRGKPLTLSNKFSEILKKNAEWWQNWLAAIP